MLSVSEARAITEKVQKKWSGEKAETATNYNGATRRAEPRQDAWCAEAHQRCNLKKPTRSYMIRKIQRGVYLQVVSAKAIRAWGLSVCFVLLPSNRFCIQRSRI